MLDNVRYKTRQILIIIFFSESYGIRVYYPELQYEDVVEEAFYTTEKLLCDIGGAAGLFLGCRSIFCHFNINQHFVVA